MGNNTYTDYAITYTFTEAKDEGCSQAVAYIQTKIKPLDKYIIVKEFGKDNNNPHIHLFIRLNVSIKKCNIKLKFIENFYKIHRNFDEQRFHKFNALNCKIAHNKETYLGNYLLKEEKREIIYSDFDLDKEKLKAQDWNEANKHKNPNNIRLVSIGQDTLIGLIMTYHEDPKFRIEYWDQAKSKLPYINLKIKKILKITDCLYSKLFLQMVIVNLIKKKYSMISHFKKLKAIHNQLTIYYNHDKSDIYSILDDYIEPQEIQSSMYS